MLLVNAAHPSREIQKRRSANPQLNQALNDYWQFWRPITAIREADTDGNRATEADPTWLPLFDPATPVCHTPLLFTPPFPDHPSGHASATAAFLYSPELLRHRQDWLQRVQQQICTTRRIERFSDALKEVIDARVWAGIHFRTADMQGAVLGNKVAHYLKKHYFQPVQGGRSISRTQGIANRRQTGAVRRPAGRSRAE